LFNFFNWLCIIMWLLCLIIIELLLIFSLSKRLVYYYSRPSVYGFESKFRDI
jgi:hypothetical protein